MGIMVAKGSKKGDLVYGIGINDVYGDCIRTSEFIIVYSAWKGMLQRCYSPIWLEKHPSYIGTKVCDEWKYYSNYKSWHLNNYIEGYELDKDIIDGKSKIYSPYTCSFVPPLINTCILDGGNTSYSSPYPLGVSYHKKAKQMKNERSRPYETNITLYGKRKNLGSFKTPEEAHKAWQFTKRDYLLELINKYCNDVVPEVIQGLQRRVDILNYDIKNSRETKSLSKV